MSMIFWESHIPIRYEEWQQIPKKGQEAVRELFDQTEIQSKQNVKEARSTVQFIKKEAGRISQQFSSDPMSTCLQLIQEVALQQQKVLVAKNRKIRPILLQPRVYIKATKEKQEVEEIQKIVMPWQRIVEAQHVCSARDLVHTKTIERDIDETLESFDVTIKDLLQTMNSFHSAPSKDRETSLYIAHDINHRLLGVMSTSNNRITELVTNPVHQNLLGSKRETIRGTGKALVACFARHVMHSHEKKEITLDSLSQARSFYERLGFEDLNPYNIDDHEMILREKNLQQLVQRSAKWSIVYTDSPEKKRHGVRRAFLQNEWDDSLVYSGVMRATALSKDQPFFPLMRDYIHSFLESFHMHPEVMKHLATMIASFPFLEESRPCTDLLPLITQLNDYLTNLYQSEEQKFKAVIADPEKQKMEIEHKADFLSRKRQRLDLFDRDHDIHNKTYSDYMKEEIALNEKIIELISTIHPYQQHLDRIEKIFFEIGDFFHMIQRNLQRLATKE